MMLMNSKGWFYPLGFLLTYSIVVVYIQSTKVLPVVKEVSFREEDGASLIPKANVNVPRDPPSAPPRAPSHDREFLELLQNQQNCSAIEIDSSSIAIWKHDHSKNTASCPCGGMTSPNLSQRMIEHYGHLDHALLEKCLQVKLPLTSKSPKECWPRMFISVSYPTSGNELSRHLTSVALQSNQLLAQYRESYKAPFYQFAPFNKFALAVTSNCVQGPFDALDLPMPMMGRAAIWKSHGPKQWGHRANWTFTQDNFPSEDEADPSLHTHGIIHLTRNPGDHLLRDGVRWNHSCKDWNSTKCKNKLDEICPQMAHKARSWIGWHNFWLKKRNFPKTPHFFYAYEHFSNVKFTRKVTEKLVDFIGESMRSSGSEIEKLVREPSYVHGTQLAKYCGSDVAREVHEVTKEVTDEMGYQFDSESASWSLPDP